MELSVLFADGAIYQLPTISGRMSQTSANRPFIDVTQQDIISEITNCLRPSVADGTPISALVLPSSIVTRFDPIDSGEEWASAHIALQTYAAFGMGTAQSSPVNGTADKLLKRIRTSHHAG